MRNARLERYIFDLQNDSHLAETTNRLYSLIDEMISIAKKRDVDKRDFTSNIAFLDAVMATYVD